MSTLLRSGVLVVLAAFGSAACTTTRAEVAVERPALDVPPPPPRLIVPLPPPPQSPRPDPVPALSEPGTSPSAKPRPPREKEAPPKPEAKPEEKPAETTPPANPSPVPPLRIPAGGDPGEQAAQIRTSIDRTLGTLNGIDYQKLQEARRKQYDEAKAFANQAEQALKEKNLVVAKEFADKAERLTKELTGR